MHSDSELSYSNSESDVSAVGLDPAVDLACMLGLLENLPLDHHLNTADSGRLFQIAPPGMNAGYLCNYVIHVHKAYVIHSGFDL